MVPVSPRQDAKPERVGAVAVATMVAAAAKVGLCCESGSRDESSIDIIVNEGLAEDLRGMTGTGGNTTEEDEI